MNAAIRLGTAGWTIPTADAGAFPGEGSHLERYARVFNAAEINSSFHRPHRPATYERWAAAVPESFRFAVKTPRTATHDQRLADCGDILDRFAGEAAGLGLKLGVVLVQLPPSLAFDAAIAERFFTDLRARFAADIVCEPRHASWFGDEADALLVTLGIARVGADPAPAEGAEHPGGARHLLYLRLHGSPRIYRSPYGAEQRAEIAGRLLAAGTPAWCIFDNTASGAATGDALSVRRLTGCEPPPILA